jgi:50S ribosomal protein L16 3-hydroxylase
VVFEQLLGNVPQSVFMQEYFLRLPFSQPGGCRHLVFLGAWDRLERILTRPGVDLLAGREGQPWDGEPPSTSAAVRSLLAAGYTLRIRHVERHDEELKTLAEGFQRDFQSPIDIHLYCTPGGQPGFGWHYDAEDVFILQTQGSKEWQLRKNTVNPWPLVETLPADMRYDREIMPLMRCNLAAGDWLYIPAGYWHRTQAGEESISLSVGILSATAIDVYDFLRPYLLSSLRWRQRLPATGDSSPLSPDDLLRSFRTLFEELGQDLAQLLQREDVARAFVQKKASPLSPTGPHS